jgi:L-fuculose-phosphate aldolase
MVCCLMAHHNNKSKITFGIAISVIYKFQHIIEEAKIVVGNPVLISNKPPGSAELAKSLDKDYWRV